MSSVYCIVVTYNGEKYIEKCLDSLCGSIPTINIIVIDNNSKDRTVAILDCIEKAFENLSIIKLPNNVGFGKANNMGIELAYRNGADYILLINQDVYINTSAINNLILVAKNNKEYGIISPLHLNKRQTGFDPIFRYFISPPFCEILADISSEKVHLKQVYPCQFVNAAAWLLTKYCIEEVGGFDSLFFHYGEDNDYVNRVRNKRLKVGVTPDAHICHDRSIHNLTNFSIYYQNKVQYLYEMKDINLGYVMAIIKTFRKLLTSATSNIKARDLHSLFTDIKIILFLSINLGVIWRHRSISYNTHAFVNLSGKVRGTK